jgi:aminoglycoside phosphotransferase family enzyme
VTTATYTKIASARRPNVDLDRKVGFLSKAAAYQEQTLRVERIETHFSWVFLTDRHVYKLKKPLRNGGVDFSTLAARRQNAEQELKLNRRLARDVYLAVLPLTLDKGGLAIGGGGAVVDWLVQMRRLPAQQMLDACLARGDRRYAEISALGALLAGFFAAATRAKITPRAYVGRLRSECRLSRRAFWYAGDPALRREAETIGRRLEAFIARRGRLLWQRVEQGWVVEGHGDLRPEHVCLRPTPLVIDCLEFRADLRFLDPLDELAFLAMECERLGSAEIGPILFDRYHRRTGDKAAPVLINFYKAVNALIRARIAILHLRELPVREPAKWPKRAAEYLSIAGREAGRLGF